MTGAEAAMQTIEHQVDSHISILLKISLSYVIRSTDAPLASKSLSARCKGMHAGMLPRITCGHHCCLSSAFFEAESSTGRGASRYRSGMGVSMMPSMSSAVW